MRTTEFTPGKGLEGAQHREDPRECTGITVSVADTAYWEGQPLPAQDRLGPHPGPRAPHPRPRGSGCRRSTETQKEAFLLL